MKRISISSLIAEDEAAVIEMLLDPDVMKFLGPRRALTKVEAKVWFQGEYSCPSRFALRTLNTNELVGFCGIKTIDDVLDFGYFIRRKYWGQGFATEVCELSIARLKENTNFNNVEVFIAKENVASVHIAGKLGWKKLKEVKKREELGYLYRIQN